MKRSIGMKQKTLFLIGSSVLITILIAHNLLNIFFCRVNELHTEKSVSSLLSGLASEPESLQEGIDWVAANMNLTIHVLDNIEHLESRIPENIHKDNLLPEVLSDQDKKQLNAGMPIVNKLNLSHTNLNLLLFIHPIMEDETIDRLLFMHMPVNTNGQESTYTLFTICLTLLVIGITLLIAKKIFKNAYEQISDIKIAAMEVSKGNYDTNLWNKTSDEIGEIAEVFNEMTESLKKEQTRIIQCIEDIAHEIRSPLSLVKSYNQALMDGVIQNPPDQHKCHQLIDREADRLNKLLQNGLDFAKLGADAVELNMQPIVFAQSMDDILRKYQLTFYKHNIDVDIQMDYDIIVSADEERLEQIIQNIVRNAIKYTKEDARLQILLERKDTTCLLSIADNGIGISEEHLSIITNRFVRVKKVRSRNESGTGLGLSIVEKLMELHGGNMMIESQVGKGTTVKLEFPLLEIECH